MKVAATSLCCLCCACTPQMYQAWDETVKEVKAYDYVNQVGTFLGKDELPPLPDTGWQPVQNPQPRYHPARKRAH